MKTPATLVSAVLIALSLSSCGMLKGKYARNQNATTAYLADNKTAPSRINVEGLWYSPQWGIVLLNQEAGGKLSGIFQDYYVVDGVISGKQIFIALRDDDWTEYTVKLTPKSHDELVGFYSSSVPFSEKDQQELVLKKIDR